MSTQTNLAVTPAQSGGRAAVIVELNGERIAILPEEARRLARGLVDAAQTGGEGREGGPVSPELAPWRQRAAACLKEQLNGSGAGNRMLMSLVLDGKLSEPELSEAVEILRATLDQRSPAVPILLDAVLDQPGSDFHEGPLPDQVRRAWDELRKAGVMTPEDGGEVQTIDLGIRLLARSLQRKHEEKKREAFRASDLETQLREREETVRSLEAEITDLRGRDRPARMSAEFRDEEGAEPAPETAEKRNTSAPTEPYPIGIRGSEAAPKPVPGETRADAREGVEPEPPGSQLETWPYPMTADQALLAIQALAARPGDWSFAASAASVTDAAVAKTLVQRFGRMTAYLAEFPTGSERYNRRLAMLAASLRRRERFGRVAA